MFCRAYACLRAAGEESKSPVFRSTYAGRAIHEVLSVLGVRGGSLTRRIDLACERGLLSNHAAVDARALSVDANVRLDVEHGFSTPDPVASRRLFEFADWLVADASCVQKSL